MERIKNEKHGKSFSSLIKQYSTHFRSHLDVFHGHSSCRISSTTSLYMVAWFRFLFFDVYIQIYVQNIQTLVECEILQNDKKRYNKCAYVYHLHACSIAPN